MASNDDGLVDVTVSAQAYELVLCAVDTWPEPERRPFGRGFQYAYRLTPAQHAAMVAILDAVVAGLDSVGGYSTEVRVLTKAADAVRRAGKSVARASQEWRAERAHRAGIPLAELDEYVAKVVAAAGDMNDEQIEKVRRLLPPVKHRRGGP
jgi:hypothetical protein